jgi:DNA-directed RNA polymerase subunit M/transcription elongation factor TFIIS
MLRLCKDCQAPYETRRKKWGLITQCDDCGRKEERKRKVIRPRVFRGESAEYVRKTAKRENAVGFNANLPVNNPIGMQKFIGAKEEKERK